MVRPRKEIDKKELYKIAKINPTDAEIARCFGMSRDTFYTRCQDDPELKEILEQARAEWKVSLRRLQWEAAERGNTTMLIWLGKQYLGQSDKQHIQQESYKQIDISSQQLVKIAQVIIEEEPA